MTTNRCTIRATASDVLAVLTRASDYPRWVVGPRETVAVDDDWPDPGSGFVHETGRGPLRFRDRTDVLRLDRDAGEIELQAGSGPLGRARVLLQVVDLGDRVRVLLHEDAIDGPLRWLPGPVRHLAIDLRNRPALLARRRRLQPRPAPRRPTTPRSRSLTEGLTQGISCVGRWRPALPDRPRTRGRGWPRPLAERPEHGML